MNEPERTQQDIHALRKHLNPDYVIPEPDLMYGPAPNLNPIREEQKIEHIDLNVIRDRALKEKLGGQAVTSTENEA